MTVKKYIPVPGKAVYVIVDMQQRLANAMEPPAMNETAQKAALFANGCGLLDIPVIEIRQYPQGLGDTVEPVKSSVPANAIHIDKATFSAYTDPVFVSTLLKMATVDTVFIGGMESHICVLQTAVDLLSAGYNVHILADAVISRTRQNCLSGINYMQCAGAVITNVETALFQMLGSSKHPKFKEISALIK